MKLGTKLPKGVVVTLKNSWTHSPCPLPGALYYIKYCVLFEYPLFCEYLPRAVKKN